jgi:hypothetical protein
MNDYPRTIDNGAGEKLIFHGIRSDERGEYVEATNSVSPGGGPPMHVHHLQEEYVLSRYRSEFGMADIPASVQRFVFPVVVAIGRLLGLGRRFAGAPEPVK